MTLKYEIWCDDCDTWVSEVEPSTLNTGWLCCSACGNGVIRYAKAN